MNNFAIRLQTNEIIFKYACGIQEQSENEYHTLHEMYYSLGDDIEFISETGTRMIHPNTMVLIPKGTFHQFVHKDNTDCTRCVFKFDDFQEWGDLVNSKFKTMRVVKNDKISQIIALVKEMCNSKLSVFEKQILLKSYLAQILIAITDADEKSDLTDQESPFSPITREAISYIGRNLTSSLSLSSISKALNISPSHLSHTFKSEMNISLHKFILNKRLIDAKYKIINGVPATRVAIDCGFKDYSNFHIQYKKRYGCSPSQDQSKT